MRNRSLERVRVDDQTATRVRFQPTAGQVDAVGRANASRRVQQGFGTYAPPAFQNGDRRAMFDLDPGDLLSQPDRHAPVAQLMSEILDQFAIDKLQE